MAYNPDPSRLFVSPPAFNIFKIEIEDFVHTHYKKSVYNVGTKKLKKGSGVRTPDTPLINLIR
ncbi:hypothetical protein MTR_4g026995 [Medicago truncatula]|uniref:Uncharacterized protein n=1 Tax=Medicago truncatula TaxID=3880 RepID=A0A072UTE0_MEDTR|nr:hypothetical protein MTR_4g026995 [Medicago truncatula]